MILDAARIRLRSHGPEGLSMRGLGKDLGVEAMSLYKHVGRREELLVHLRRQLFESVELPEPSSPPHRDLEEVCWALFRAFSAFEGAAYLISSVAIPNDEIPESGARPTPEDASAEVRVLERLLVPLSQLIPEPRDRAYALRCIYGYVAGQVSSRAIDVERALHFGVRLGDDSVSRVVAIFEELSECLPEVTFEIGLRALVEAIQARRGF